MIEKEYIEKVLAHFEGRAIQRGYVPCKGGTFYGSIDCGEPLGASGVTVATGVDLGQQTRRGLLSMGISERTVAALAPYIGLKKTEAVERLRAAPLALTPEQVAEIDNAVHNRYIEEAALLFGPDAFAAAPKEAQAVAVSLHYQFGEPRRPASPALALAWEAMRLGKYVRAAAYLRDANLWSEPHRAYMNRRRQEAAILEAVI